MGEHLPCKQGVKSSNLSISTQCGSAEDKVKGKTFWSLITLYLENYILKISS